jgi:hypothetical protein
MASITIRADNDVEVTLIVSSADALGILLKYQSQYPNGKTGMSLTQFINKWTEPNEEQANGRFKR